LLSFLQDPLFVGALQQLSHEHPGVILPFVPQSQLLALLLPNDHDPTGLTPGQIYWLNIVMIIAAFIGTAILLPVTIAGFVALGLAFVVAVIAEILAGDAYSKALDCDLDGDPEDPNDRPGIEC